MLAISSLKTQPDGDGRPRSNPLVGINYRLLAASPRMTKGRAKDSKLCLYNSKQIE